MDKSRLQETLGSPAETSREEPRKMGVDKKESLTDSRNIIHSSVIILSPFLIVSFF